MGDAVVDNLIVDLLLWLATGEKTYEQVIEAWRTSCPKLPVWEDANDRGFVEISVERGTEHRVVRITAAGQEFLTQHPTAPNK